MRGIQHSMQRRLLVLRVLRIPWWRQPGREVSAGLQHARNTSLKPLFPSGCASLEENSVTHLAASWGLDHQHRRLHAECRTGEGALRHGDSDRRPIIPGDVDKGAWTAVCRHSYLELRQRAKVVYQLVPWLCALRYSGQESTMWALHLNDLPWQLARCNLHLEPHRWCHQGLRCKSPLVREAARRLGVHQARIGRQVCDKAVLQQALHLMPGHDIKIRLHQGAITAHQILQELRLIVVVESPLTTSYELMVVLSAFGARSTAAQGQGRHRACAPRVAD
mmetsp:Transcript_61148/g.175435  ORF Transcript_61148/g.175435 Transcript_61148/m.175435 type:complete len:278 (+) Transcript_61148:82-915(+)